MDLFTPLLTVWQALPPPAQQACGTVAAFVGDKIAGEAWGRLTKKDEFGVAFAGVYQTWREGFLNSDVDEKTSADAFQDYFCRAEVTRELEKLRLYQFAEIDFDVLTEQLKESCEWAGCPVPDTDLHRQLSGWIAALEELLAALPEFEERYRPTLDKAVRSLKESEPGIRNFSLARHAYLQECAAQHRLLKFRGIARVGGPPEVEITKVFVTPRVEIERGPAGPQPGPDFGDAKSQPIPATQLLAGGRAKSRIVIQGKPGSGKTTLMEYFSLALARAAEPQFEWARRLGGLLPVFYRVRELEADLRAPGDGPLGIWECLHGHCTERMAVRLPMGFFRRQMGDGGVLFLFDGLDEVATEKRRNEIVDLVAAFARRLPANSRVIITSRPYEYTRSRFASDEYEHYELCDFDDGEIQTFIDGWCEHHRETRASAREEADQLWQALQNRPDIKPLAGNALLLTMIVMVHWSLRALPDSRADLYAKCVETLLEHWHKATGLESGPLGPREKERFLAELAYKLQCEASGARLTGDVPLQISRRDLIDRLEEFFVRSEGKRLPDLAELVLEKLHSRDAILVNYGEDQFGFVHRSFQEYFAAWWLAEEVDSAELDRMLIDEPPGWKETLYLAVAQMRERDRRRVLIDSVKRNQAPFALACLRAKPIADRWLGDLVEFLARCYVFDLDESKVTVEDCADSCADRPETMQVLRALFELDNRDGRSVAAALELAEELARRGMNVAGEVATSFLAESKKFGLDSDDQMVTVDAGPILYRDQKTRIEVSTFKIDRYLVTNIDYERMIPAHRKLRNTHASENDQPAIFVNWHEAQLFCRWRGLGFRLPTHTEWIKAATWDVKTEMHRRYPWGRNFDPQRCNTGESGLGRTSAVRAYPQGVSPWGCFDMVGNVSEWTQTPITAHEFFKAVLGGAWNYNYEEELGNKGIVCLTTERFNFVGFRCVRT